MMIYYVLLRLTKHTHRINSGKIETLAVNTYDDLGRLKSKKIGNTEVNPLQDIDYKYNIRGWMTDINNVDASLSDATKLFAFKISYDQLKYGPRRAETATSLYNGNISQTFWKSSSDNTLRSYDYSYDGVNQLTDAIFYKGIGIFSKNYYNENIAYDNNGNITTLQRNGDTENGSTPIVIDNLRYNYISNSNKLSYVTDLSVHPSGFSSTKTGVLYEYDGSGNLKKDNSKDIVDIKYNHLNLATEVLWLNGSTITFVYDATGKKIRKEVSKVNQGTNKTITKTDYLEGFQYKNGSLQFFPTAEGYVNVIVKDNTEKLSYVYNYKDHLGNTRVSYAWDENENKLKTIAENHYYPYGLQHSGYEGGKIIGDLEDGEISYPKAAALPGIDIGVARMDYSGNESYAYHYNGNEFQSDLGINWYDMNLRMYDPALARWMVQDPVVHYTKSPYNSFDNNPVYFADPSGATNEGSNDSNDGGNGIADTKMGFGVTAGQLAGVSKIEYWSVHGDTTSGNRAINTSKSNDKDGSKDILSKQVSNNSDYPDSPEGSIDLPEVFIKKYGELNSLLNDRVRQAYQIWGNWGKGSFMEANFNFAFMGGFGVTFGRVKDTFGKSAFFFSFNGNIGWGGGFGFDAGTIETTNGNAFNIGDMEGEGSAYSLGLTTPVAGVGYNYGGSIDSQKTGLGSGKMNPTNFGESTINRGYIQKSVSIGPSGKFEVGAMYQNSHTYLLR
ncbi:RHS repeat domain-containing protein [Empedobacter tilapiae]|uniref:RHS repeat-associated core domain-containing protein n=1 Tax=Empedobacter tilapiae TaxID=2491114 RepID=A0A4Z1BAD7_9FLAO|nr:RHS repeat-associated core domain-containing protein [Empedobacter tilapiae]TGN21939.1 hypothetical protein E4J94_16750 [Empedobacter tilapiae]